MTTEDLSVLRERAIENLARCGIEGAQVYLIDIIPLIQMIWADGRVQPGEVVFLSDYIEKHVSHINGLAGYEMLTIDDAQRFVGRFLNTRPDPELLKTLQALIPTVRLSTSDPEANKALRQSLLAACMDVAAIDKIDTSTGLPSRFDPAEKVCFFEILESLEEKSIES